MRTGIPKGEGIHGGPTVR